MRHLLGTLLAKYSEHRAHLILSGNPQLWADLTDYLSKTKSTGCSYSDLAELYLHIRSTKPANVLELGTGVSTVVIGHALKANASGIVQSMEESERWYIDAKAFLPAHLSGNVVLHYSPAVEKSYGFFKGAGYKDIPKLPYDFMFVDGPSFQADPNGDDYTFNFDLIEVLQNAERPMTAFIDTRHSTCWVYQQLLGDKFRYDYIRKLGVLLPSTKHDLLTTKALVRKSMARHAFKRPPLIKYLLSMMY